MILRLLLIRIQITERHKAVKANTIFTPDQIFLTTSERVILNSTGTKVANGRMLIISAAIPSF